MTRNEAIGGSPNLFADRRLDKEIDDMVDDAKGIKDVSKLKYKSGTKSGKKTRYSILSKKPDFNIADNKGGTEYRENLNYDILQAADEIARENGMRNPQQTFEVSWETRKDPSKLDAKEKKSAALDAVTTWREDVLPTLKPGMIVYNKPTTFQRARMYEIAGFSPQLDDYSDFQFAIVIEDESGENKLVPINPSQQEVKEDIDINPLFYILNFEMLDEDQINTAYKVLFEG